MPYTPILATLGYVLSTDKQRVLMIHRNRRVNDPHFGKYNGLGGKLETCEDVITGMKREIREEAGIECVRMQLRGTINWPGFGQDGQHWFGFIFLIQAYRGEPLTQNAEGSLAWVARTHLLDLPLWEGDRFFLPLVFDDDERPFHGVMRYNQGKPVSWDVSRS